MQPDLKPKLADAPTPATASTPLPASSALGFDWRRDLPPAIDRAVRVAVRILKRYRVLILCPYCQRVDCPVGRTRAEERRDPEDVNT